MGAEAEKEEEKIWETEVIANRDTPFLTRVVQSLRMCSWRSSIVTASLNSPCSQRRREECICWLPMALGPIPFVKHVFPDFCVARTDATWVLWQLLAQGHQGGPRTGDDGVAWKEARNSWSVHVSNKSNWEQPARQTVSLQWLVEAAAAGCIAMGIVQVAPGLKSKVCASGVSYKHNHPFSLIFSVKGEETDARWEKRFI